MARKHATREEAEETRRTILRTAQQLFMDYGYRAVSTRQIADACGLTQPALYHYFADKQALYVAVMQEDMAKTQAALERIARRNESVEERLRRVVRYLLNSTQHDLGWMLHDVRQEVDAQARATLYNDFQAGLIAPIASIFRAGIQQGLLRDAAHDGVDETTATYLFMNMLSRFLSQKAHPDTAFTGIHEQERAEIIVHILLHGIAYGDTRQTDVNGRPHQNGRPQGSSLPNNGYDPPQEGPHRIG